MGKRSKRRDRSDEPKQEREIATGSRGRGLAELEDKLGPGRVVDWIETRRSGGPVRVLEIGCGEGRLLLDLRRRFPDIDLIGINKAPWPRMTGRSSFRDTALRYGIFTKDELARVRLPEVHFHDARELALPDASVDLVLSQTAIQYMARKDLVLQEIWRVLKRGGAALVNIDTRIDEMPDYLDHECPRWIVYDDEEAIPLSRVLAEVREAGYDIRVEEDRQQDHVRVNVVATKNLDEPLNLALEYDQVSSFNLKHLGPKGDEKGTVYWGRRSVFRRVRDPSSSGSSSLG